MNGLKEKSSVRCLACHSDATIAAGELEAYPAAAMYCRDCNCFFPSEIPKESDLSFSYQNYTFNPPPSGRWTSWRLRNIFARKCRKIKSVLKGYGPSLLDFGGGCGLYARGFRDVGFSTAMIEVDRAAIEIAIEMGVEAMLYEKVSSRYDIVFSSHVIEHYEDLDLFFERVKTLLKPGAIAVIACPNKDSKEFYRIEHLRGYLKMIKSSKLRSFVSNPWWCLDPPRHYYALSASTLAVLAGRHGFTVIDQFSEFSTRSQFSHNDMYALVSLENLLNPLKLLYKVYVNMLSLLMSVFFRRSLYGDNLVSILKLNATGSIDVNSQESIST